MKSTLSRSLRNVTCLAAALMAPASFLNASTIGYWQFDDGSSGADVSSVSSESNNASFTSGIQDGFGGAGTGTAQFSSNVVTGVGEVIRDGVGGAVVNSDNTTSIRFVQQSDSMGKMLQINDGATGLLEPTGAFTLEAFVLSEAVTFRAAINKQQFATTSSAGFGTDFSNTRIRILAAGSAGNAFDTNGAAGGPINNGNWHHTAVVYDGAGTVSLYYDYNLANTFAADPTSSWQASAPLSIAGLTGNGGSGSDLFDGYVDELRYSDTALATNDFLVVGTIPEPSTYALLGGLIAIGAVVMGRRRKS